MKNVVAKCLLVFALLTGVSAGATAESRETPVGPGQASRITENEQELSELRWEMMREENERGHEIFVPGSPLSVPF